MYESFLGVPLIDRGVLQGVLVVQTVEARTFCDEEVHMLVSAAAQVAPVVSEARTLARFIAPVQERLWALARNLWWSWDPDSTNLFLDLDPARWRQLNQNPVALLGEMSLAKLERRAEELVLHSRIHYAYRRQQEYLAADRTWGATHAGVLRTRPVAYFSAEFGLHESFPVYSGGLGVLSGDHIKSASDLGHSADRDRPVLRPGIFPATSGSSGWQHEEYIKTDVNQLPMEPAIGANGEPVTIEIETRGTSIRAKVWRVKVGRCDLLLLDSNVAGNAPEDRDLTSRLYGGDERAPHPSGAAAGRGRIPRAEGHGHYARSASSERGPQRIRRARGDPLPHGRGGRRIRCGGSAGCAGSRLHHPHTGRRRATTASSPI